MPFVLLFLILVVFPILLSLLHSLFWKRRHLPPGPLPLPLIGNLVAIARSPPGYAPFQQWAKEYGPIFTVCFGEDPTVVITDFALLKETQGDAFAGRHYSTKLFKCFRATRGLQGIIRTEGNQWKELRRFSMKTMRDLGVGRTGMEHKILAHIDAIIRSVRNRISADSDAKIWLEPLLDVMSGSAISEMMFGYSFSGEREMEFHELKRHMNAIQAIQGSTRGQLLDSMPWLRHLPLFAQTFNQLDCAMEQLYAFFDRHIEANLRRRRAGEKNDGEEKDFVGVFLDEMKRMAADGEGKDGPNYFTMDALRGLCFDIFVAGQETSTNTLNFLFLYLLLDQRVQLKVHAELDKLGSGPAHVGMAHRPQLPFLCAVINETQRLCNLLPINLSHRTMRDAKVGPHLLPKGTPLLPQIGNVHFDEKIFPEPYKFIPERFIDAEGRLVKCEQLVPFGIGKRQCAGESLAKMELFLFAANFLLHFRVANPIFHSISVQILPADPLNPPTTEKKTLLTVMPKEYECRVVQRPRGEKTT